MISNIYTCVRWVSTSLYVHYSWPRAGPLSITRVFRCFGVSARLISTFSFRASSCTAAAGRVIVVIRLFSRLYIGVIRSPASCAAVHGFVFGRDFRYRLRILVCPVSFLAQDSRLPNSLSSFILLVGTRPNLFSSASFRVCRWTASCDLIRSHLWPNKQWPCGLMLHPHNPWLLRSLVTVRHARRMCSPVPATRGLLRLGLGFSL